MYENEKVANAAARFMPMTDGGILERPGIEICGVQVYAYFEEGRFVVALAVDGEVSPEFLSDGGLPYEFVVNGEELASEGIALEPPEELWA